MVAIVYTDYMFKESVHINSTLTDYSYYSYADNIVDIAIPNYINEPMHPTWKLFKSNSVSMLKTEAGITPVSKFKKILR